MTMDAVKFGYARLAKPWQTSVKGWRFMVPIWARHRNAFDIRSEWREGLWFFALNFIVAPIDAGESRVGLSVKLVWGWVPSPSAAFVTA